MATLLERAQASRLSKENGLVLVNYKEPLIPIEEGFGFGYVGAILTTLDGSKIQCHICGDVFSMLGPHILAAHGMNVVDYRDRFDLARTTKLISETRRQEMKERALAYFASLSESEILEIKQRAREGNLNRRTTEDWTWEIRLETKNKRGTCPDQCLEKIRTIAEKLGRTPSLDEFIVECGTQRWMHAIRKTFGTWNNAVEKAGLTPKERKRDTRGKKYTDEELLEILAQYWRTEGIVPTETDVRRGLIPDSAIYCRRFGSLVEARRLAGITEKPRGRWG
jgi:hypothetical protein